MTLSQRLLKCMRIISNVRLISGRPPRPSDAKRSGGIGRWIMLGIPVATFGLGTWQVSRRTWKNDLIKKINSRTRMDPIPLPEIKSEEELKSFEYFKFSVDGIFDHSKELYIRPRSIVTSKDDHGAGSLFSSKPRIGAQVVTPLYIPDRGYSILVNRGFVDEDRMNPKTRKSGQVSGTVSVRGIFRLTEKGYSIPSNDPNRSVWQSVNVEQMAQVTGCRPILLEATADTTVPDGPIGGQSRIRLRNQHASYIITWYSISALTAAIWYSKYLR